MGDNDDSMTYLDEIYQRLLFVDVENVCIEKLKYFVKSQEYESESVEYDLVDNDNKNETGNIELYIDNTHCIETIKSFIKTQKISFSSFNIGLRFYYWKYYKSLKQIADKDQDRTTNIDHSGYNISDLYIAPKYSSFKKEIANYKDIDFKQYEQEIKIKAETYQKTPIVKATKAAGLAKYGWRGHNKGLYYGISGKARFGFPNLVSLILYTDYSAVSCDFSSSFRKISPFETLKSIKQRNAEYYWLSKTLRETVEIFGQCSDEDSTNGALRGSYF